MASRVFYNKSSNQIILDNFGHWTLEIGIAKSPESKSITQNKLLFSEQNKSLSHGRALFGK